MKQVILSLTLMAFLYYSATNTWTIKSATETETETETETKYDKVKIEDLTNLPSNFKKLPIGEHIYVSASPCDEAYRSFSKLGLLSTVRLNGNGTDAGCMSIEQEAATADLHEMRLSYFNIDNGNRWPLKRAVRMAENDYVLIHCKHGVHRAILVAACYMLSKDVPYNDVLEWTGWTKGRNPVYNDPNYSKYVETLKRWSDWYSA